MAKSPSSEATQFALLGIVAAEAATAYALAKRMEETYSYFWPRARSHVYVEIKRLEALGYVRRAATKTGNRPSATFTITDKGQKALKAWLARPSQVFSLELEPLLRVHLAEHGTEEGLLAAIAHADQEASSMLAVAHDVLPAYLESSPSAGKNIRDSAILFDFLVGYAGFVREWSKRSAAFVGKSQTGDGDKRARKLVKDLIEQSGASKAAKR